MVFIFNQGTLCYITWQPYPSIFIGSILAQMWLWQSRSGRCEWIRTIYVVTISWMHDGYETTFISQSWHHGVQILVSHPPGMGTISRFEVSLLPLKYRFFIEDFMPISLGFQCVLLIIKSMYKSTRVRIFADPILHSLQFLNVGFLRLRGKSVRNSRRFDCQTWPKRR